MTGTLHEDQCIVMIISRSVSLRMRNISDISCSVNQNTFYVQKYFSEIRAFCEILGKILVQPERPYITYNIIWPMLIA